MSARAASQKAYNLNGLRILVVEDFPFMADLMAAMLREFNVGKILSVCKIEEAQRLVTTYNVDTPQSQHIDMIMTDLFPPRNEGLEMMKWIRAHKKESIKFTPVLFCTAHTSLQVVTSGRDTGATEILMKPVSAEKLAHRLLYIIDHPRPFVRAPEFFGPDRRRKNQTFVGSERRVNTDIQKKVSND